MAKVVRSVKYRPIRACICRSVCFYQQTNPHEPDPGNKCAHVRIMCGYVCDV